MKISVITVVKNGAAYIKDTLDSVLSQSWQDIEHIVIDGGSTDETLSIVTTATRHSPYLHVESAPDKGISDAMNKGLAFATGDVVCWLHADDFFAGTHVLEAVVQKFDENPEADWLTGGMLQVDAAGQTIRAFSVRSWSRRRLLRGNTLFHPATFIRRRVLEILGGFDSSLRYAMDYDLWLRLAERSDPVLINASLACFRVHSGSLSVSQVDAAFREEYAVRCRYLQGRPVQQMLHLLYYIIKFLPNRLSVRCVSGR